MNMLFIYLFAFCSICTTNGFSGFILPDAELTYKYEANIQVGTVQPVEQASQMAIKGLLRLKHHNNTIIAEISDLKHAVYNGKINGHDEHSSIYLKLPLESESILSQFKIIYNELGLVDHIKTARNEPEFARNMKKAIASILQLDYRCFDFGKPNSFKSKENSIYGKNDVFYSIIPRNDQLIVQKIQTVKLQPNWFRYYTPNLDDLYQDSLRNAPEDSLININNSIVYTLVQSNEYYYFKRIDLFGGIYVNPYKLKAPQHLTVHQTIELVDKKYDSFEYTANEKEEKHNLVIDIDENFVTGVAPEITFGRHHTDTDKALNLTCRILEHIISYMETSPLTNDVLQNFDETRAVNRLHSLMSLFDLQYLEYIYKKLNETTDDLHKKMLNYYQEMIPLVGTHATSWFIRDLIVNEKIEKKIAFNMLKKMAMHIRKPSESLLDQLTPLLNINSSYVLKKTGILCFATLIHKTYEHNSNSKSLEKYILQFIEQIKSSSDDDMQYTYISALYNIKIGNVAKYLQPIIQGEIPNVNRYIQSMAMKASAREFIKHPDQVLEVYWPIMTNRSLHLELRIGAYMIITAASFSTETLFLINNYMKNESCEEFYHYHYTYLKSMVKKADHSQSYREKIAEHALNTMRKPYGHRMSGYYLLDFYDDTYKYSFQVAALVISTKTSKSLYIDVSSQILNIPHKNAIWIMVDGMDPLKHSEFIISDGFNLNKLLAKLNSLGSTKNDHHSAVFQNDQIIRLHDDPQKLDIAWQYLSIISDMKPRTTIDELSYKMLLQIFLPNALGFTTMLQVKMPSLFSFEKNVSFEFDSETNTRKNNYEINLRLSTQSLYKLNFYNPISDLFHSINQITHFDLALPLNVSFFISSINNKGNSYRLRFNKHREKSKNTFGYRSFTTSLTYVLGNELNVLKQSNDKCQSWIPVATEPLNETIQVHDIKHDKDIDLDDIVQFFVDITSTQSNVIQLLPDTILPNIYKTWTKLHILPGMKSYGILSKSSPISQDVNHIEFQLHIMPEYIDGERTWNKSRKVYEAHLKYSVKTEDDKNIRSWNLNALLSLNSAETNYSIQFDLKRETNENEDLVLCAQGQKLWLENEVNGHFYLGLKNQTDKKCLFVLDINMEGKKSNEQLTELKKLKTNQNVMPDKCWYTYDLTVPKIPKIECLVKLTSYRNYTYSVTINHTDNLLLNSLLGSEVLESTMNETVFVEFPMWQDMLKVKMGKNTHEVKSTPGLSMIGLYPDNDYYTQIVSFYDYMFLTDTYIIDKHILKNVSRSHLMEDGIGIIVNEPAIFDYDEQNGTISVLSIYAKKNEIDQMVLKIHRNKDVLEIRDGKIFKNGYPVIVSDYELHSWYQAYVLPDNTVLIYIHGWDIYVDYNGQYIRVMAGWEAEL